MPARTVRPGRVALGTGPTHRPEHYRRWRNKVIAIRYGGYRGFLGEAAGDIAPSDPGPSREPGVDDHPLMQRLVEAVAVLDAMGGRTGPSSGGGWPWPVATEPGDYKRTATPILSGVAIDRMEQTLHEWWPHCPGKTRKLLWLRASGYSYPSIVERLGLGVSAETVRRRCLEAVRLWEGQLRRRGIRFAR